MYNRRMIVYLFINLLFCSISLEFQPKYGGHMAPGLIGASRAQALDNDVVFLHQIAKGAKFVQA